MIDSVCWFDCEVSDKPNEGVPSELKREKTEFEKMIENIKIVEV
jgi:hypothetical protein